ncbi:chemotaxis protein CheW [Pararhodospirillum oryzae]|uniref:Chemotaxis protein CheW n=1 Tax=Pararhodospirillum oryzae TaxID=478448 RepID=A0A512H340_9PROT|nr:chemotaxis protein CheW [Pararhodospirillum oryzae]GEO79886.1 chemotaxis protein CheW [Pararhodospirillum oryzae]
MSATRLDSGEALDSAPPLPSLERSYVTVGIDQEIFALDVAHVREILDPQPFTRLPDMPPSLRGLIDVRGQGIPVFDLRIKFGLPPGEGTPHTRIVVLEIPRAQGAVVLGALTDRVFEVAALDDTGIERPAELGTRWRSEAVAGLGRRNGRLVIILDIAHVFTLKDLTAASSNQSGSDFSLD